MLENPGGSRTVGLNRCIDAALGEYVVRVDARSVLAPDHVRRTIARLAADSTVGVVGGHQIPWTPDPATARAAGIERALRNRWLLGNADYRDPAASGPTDTVYLGSFRTAELRRLRYDEALTANEDFDLCRRIRDAGRRVWLEPASTCSTSRGRPGPGSGTSTRRSVDRRSRCGGGPAAVRRRDSCAPWWPPAPGHS